MKEEIQSALACLVGTPLTDCWRPSLKGYEAIQRFEFGEQRPCTNSNGQERTIGEYALHIGCPWRVIGQGRILAAYIDLYFPADCTNETGGPDDFDSYTPGASHRDRQTRRIVERLAYSPLFVERIEADDVGSVFMTLSLGYRLEILPMDSLRFEFWRFLNTGRERKGKKLFVVTGRGIEE